MEGGSKKAGGGKKNVPQLTEEERAKLREERERRKKEKKEAKKMKDLAKEQSRKDKKREREQKRTEEEEVNIRVIDSLDEKFGAYPMIKSKFTTGAEYSTLKEAKAVPIGTQVWIRGRIHRNKKSAAMGFIWLRQGGLTVQVTVLKEDFGDDLKEISKIPCESVIDVKAEVVEVESQVKALSIKDRELKAEGIYVVSAATKRLPIQIEDAMARPDGDKIIVTQENRLDFRWIDLRTPANRGIFWVQDLVGRYFRQFLSEKGFVEIHTPKIISGASEGGAAIFNVNYFGDSASLAQSPQLYKQMAVMGDFEGVFEVGSVFRAEEAHTHRHLTEYIGLDVEMEIKFHYSEVLKVLGDLLNFIFKTIQEKHKDVIELVESQFTFEKLELPDEFVVIKYPDAMALLREAGIDIKDDEDIDTMQEKQLGKIVKEKYHTDLFAVDRFPACARPFYTMPDPYDERFTNSYDIFLRCEEICSGGQRIHEPELLKKQAAKHELPLAQLESYINSFRHGAVPHGGAGFGLERCVMLFLGLDNIRKASLFPRDPKRMKP